MVTMTAGVLFSSPAFSAEQKILGGRGDKATLSPTNKIKLARYLTIKTCYKDDHCIGPVVKNIEDANIEIPMKPYSKANERGQTAFEEQSVLDQGIPFKREIRVTKKEGKDEYYVYMMLRSGPSLKREGKVKTFSVKDLSQMSETRITDEPIKFKDGTLQAELILSAPLNLSK